jgi:hypothetical protein
MGDGGGETKKRPAPKRCGGLKVVKAWRKSLEKVPKRRTCLDGVEKDPKTGPPTPPFSNAFFTGISTHMDLSPTEVFGCRTKFGETVNLGEMGAESCIACRRFLLPSHPG